MQNLISKRFVIRKSLIGKNQTITVNFKNGKTCTYNHDKVYNIMKSKLNTMPCFLKYKRRLPEKGPGILRRIQRFSAASKPYDT